MADQGRWFKLWNTAPGDGKLQSLPPATRWAWAAFGCYTKVHGEHGVVSVRRSNAVLAAEMGVTVDVLFDVILTFPNMQFDLGKVDNDTITVTWLNWKKYQEDSTVYERVKKWRERQSVTVQEEKRREEKRISPKPPSGVDGFDAFWSAFPRHTAKQAALKAWGKLGPSADLQQIILAAIARQCAILTTWRERDMERIPHPSTWINGRRWEDEIPTNGSGNKQHGIVYERLR